MSNPWTRFQSLLSAGSKQIVTVTELHPNATATVSLRTGETLRVTTLEGISIGQRVIVQNSKIISQAANLPAHNVEI